MNDIAKTKLEIFTEQLYDVVPKDWVYSVNIKDDTTVALTISGAPVNLLQELCSKKTGHCKVEYEKIVEALRLKENEDLAEIFERIIDAMLNVDSLEDEHNIEINIGTPEFAFLVTEEI